MISSPDSGGRRVSASGAGVMPAGMEGRRSPVAGGTGGAATTGRGAFRAPEAGSPLAGASPPRGLTRAKGAALYLFPAISIVVPYLFLMLTFEVAVRRIIPLTALEVALLPLLVLLVGIIEYAIGAWLASERENGPAPLLRELLVVLIAGALIALALTGSLRAPLVALAGPAFWTILIGLFLQWILTHSLRTRLRDHLLFLALFAGKEGAQAQMLYRDWGAEATETLGALARIRRQIIVLLVIGLGECIIASWPLGLALPPGVVAVSVAYLLASLLAVRSLSSLAREQVALGEGAPYARRDLASAAAQALVLLGAVCVAALPFAGGGAPFSASLIGRALAWLFGLLSTLVSPRLAVPTGPHRLPSPLPSQAARALHELGSAQPPAWTALLGAILRGLGWGVLILGALALLLFLVRPLFRRRSERGRARRAIDRALRYLVELAEDVAVRLRLRFAGGDLSKGEAGWFASRRKVRGSLGRRQGGADGGLGEPGHRSRGRRVGDRRRPVWGGPGGSSGTGGMQGRLTRALFHGAFRRLIRWGERMGVDFSPSYAPLEYAGLLGRRLPEAEALLVEIAATFEEGAYAERMPSEERLARYYRAIGQVTRMKGARG